jgi:hypothetical protein
VNTGTILNLTTKTDPLQSISGSGNSTDYTVNNGLDAAGLGSLFDKLKGVLSGQPAPVTNVTVQAPASTYGQASAGTPDASSGQLAAPPATLGAVEDVKPGLFSNVKAWQIAAAIAAIIGTLFLIFNRRKKSA